MLFRVIPMICFEILSDFFGENRKKEKLETIWLFWVPTPQCREPTQRRSPMPQCGMASPLRGWGAKMAPLRYAIA